MDALALPEHIRRYVRKFFFATCRRVGEAPRGLFVDRGKEESGGRDAKRVSDRLTTHCKTNSCASNNPKQNKNSVNPGH